MTQPDEVQPLCHAFLRGLNSLLGGKLHGVYLYGAVVFPEAGPVKDVDLHVIIQESLTSTESQELNRLHADLAQHYPPLGAELDCYYVLLADARQSAPPQHQLNTDIVDNWWALHRAHMLAGKCIVLYGPEPAEIFPDPSWLELTAALNYELGWIENILDSYPAYCVLNLCRVAYSFKTKDVVISKQAAATQLTEMYPEWSPLVAAAKRIYGNRMDESDKLLLRSQMGRFRRFALDRIYTSPYWSQD